ncbi:MAG: hypothetical protein GW780_04525 [Candidatus Aenigmarchaeota archaeon]|nr:hypothetical protein [Candidatus Aenigmarchaeota archaeon]NCS71398.1 hypothetical protein [Candidatus Aenigmarchaeota archaeon]PIW41069.1 MAG: hypothetical protein COW21_03720 [Candidatus Aenigmarchaeota archaeon CG15_BIG_FIL_POST_REV_8_21_14_020_37_27]PIY35762.1 MAG: hypothetical protein COZ04_02415 [Candidatus Aenigmarchaeota archaeon CG_4_10_14_3_um_filter_37_21]PJB75104.1 MAG: hypothetical protein CO092_02850 [Candidatus Aenigmarchaeota archaeon CG_4_9_14_3_um_filter_37_18]
MFPINSNKANLKRVDYDILDFLEYPKTLEEIKAAFPGVNVTVKVLEFLDKGLIEEKKERYASKFHTSEVKRIIEESRVPEDIKKNFSFFLSQIDNPFVRQNIFSTETREKSDTVFSVMTRSLNQDISIKELSLMRLAMNDLMEKLR